MVCTYVPGREVNLRIRSVYQVVVDKISVDRTCTYAGESPGWHLGTYVGTSTYQYENDRCSLVRIKHDPTSRDSIPIAVSILSHDLSLSEDRQTLPSTWSHEPSHLAGLIHFNCEVQTKKKIRTL